MYYSQIADPPCSGLTNQIFSLVTSIIIAIKNKHHIVVVEHFLNDHTTHDYTPISEIFDMNRINAFLIAKYAVQIVDKYNMQFQLSTILYGTTDSNIDVTKTVLQQFDDGRMGLFIPKDTILNDIAGDPCYGTPKTLSIMVTIDDNTHTTFEFDEILTADIKLNPILDALNAKYILSKGSDGWITTYDQRMFHDILTHIEYAPPVVAIAEQVIITTQQNKINVLHLRLEPDAIQHWSKMNQLSEQDFLGYLENKYIEIIEKNIDRHDETIIVSNSTSNNVVHYLAENGYRFKMCEKSFPHNKREKNAIVDLLVSQHCNNIFIGNFNCETLNGSTFSYYILKRFKKGVTCLCVDLDHIHNPCNVHIT